MSGPDGTRAADGADRLGDPPAIRPAHETRAFYDDWAARYDTENLQKGMRHPFIGASLFARFVPLGASPILDAACGTGIVGEALNVLGYGPIIGCDLSPQMVERAARYGAYQDFALSDLTALPFASNAFGAFSCIGGFGPGHAAPSALYELCRVTRPGGFGVFSLREDTFRAQGFPAVMDALEASGTWREVHRTDAFRAYLLDEPALFARVVTVEILQ